MTTFLQDKAILLDEGSRLESTIKLVKVLEREDEDESHLDSQGAEGIVSCVTPEMSDEDKPPLPAKVIPGNEDKLEGQWLMKEVSSIKA